MSFWIKMRHDLDDDPAVIAMATMTGMDEFGVIGRLHNLWAWADRQTRNGHAPGVTGVWIDRRVRHEGFAAAMVAVGWLEDDGGVTFPNFDRHISESAKERALAAERKRTQRAKKPNVTPSGPDLSRHDRDTDGDEGVTRAEQSRADEVGDGDASATELGTPAGRICRKLKQAGVGRVNPGHPTLKALVEAGASDDEFLGLAPQCVDKNDPFAYLLSVMVSQREKAAQVSGRIVKGPIAAAPAAGPSGVNRQAAIEARNRQTADEWADETMGAPA